MAQQSITTLDGISEAYIKLALALGDHDSDLVDSYFGPESFRPTSKRPVQEIAAELDGLVAALQALPKSVEVDELCSLRRNYLGKQLNALQTRAKMVQGTKFTFDEESKLLYDAVAPHDDEDHFKALIRQLEPLLPTASHAHQTLAERFDIFRKEFVIPTDKLDAVFRRAIAEGRRRTMHHIKLPEEESFVVEYVTGKPWSGYNWYKGKYHSVIQVNTEFPIMIDRAIDLACHEGYPGHHVYNSLLELNLFRSRGWQEFSLFLLFSPQGLIAEGSANYGIEMCFPDVEERITWEARELFPLAGLDPSRAAVYYKAQQIAGGLAYAGNEAARGYLDGRWNQEQAVKWLVEYALFSPDRAVQRLKFIDKYRTYVINYNYGQDLVKSYIARRSAGGQHGEQQHQSAAVTSRRWAEFSKLLSSPRMPSGLAE
jgi:hypothetical protein